MTNGSTNNLISNNEGRGNGDDAFALFSAIDAGGSVGNNGNVFENLSATLTWRAAGVAVYGGYNNTFRNLYIADMLTYSGITISSLDFGYPFVGFGPRADDVREHLARPSGWPLLGQPDLRRDLGASRRPRSSAASGSPMWTSSIRRTPGIMFQTKYAGGAPEFPVHGHGLHEHLDLGRAEERRRVRRQVRLRHLGQRAARARSGPGGRFGHVQQPDLQQQLPEHQEHHDNVHAQHQLIPTGRPGDNAESPGRPLSHGGFS